MAGDRKGLNKILNTGDVLVTAFGAMIGWGWVVSTSDWIQKAGIGGTMVGFVIGGLMIYFVGLIYAELTTMESGGTKAFVERAYGANITFICTWMMILSYIGVVCFEACSLPTIVQYVFPNFMKGYLYTIGGFDVYASWLVFGIIAVMLITVVNILGIKAAAIMQTVLTLVIAIVGAILVIASLVNGNVSNLNGQMFVGEGLQGVVKNTFAVAMVTPFFLFGFDVIPQVAEEINVPLKRLGRLLVLSIAMAVCFYGLVVFGVGYGMNATEIQESLSSSGLVTAAAMAKVFHSSSMAKVLIIGGMCGIITSWNSFLIGGSRIMYSMAESHMLPTSFEKLHPKFKTPVVALVFSGVLSIAALFFGRRALVWISDCASFACCLSYCIVSVAFLKLRKKEPHTARPYKVRRYRAVGVVSIIMTGALCMMYLIPFTGTMFSVQECVIIIVWIALGTVMALYAKVRFKEKFGE